MRTSDEQAPSDVVVEVPSVTEAPSSAQQAAASKLQAAQRQRSSKIAKQRAPPPAAEGGGIDFMGAISVRLFGGGQPQPNETGTASRAPAFAPIAEEKADTLMA